MDFFFAEWNVVLLLPVLAAGAIALTFLTVLRRRRGAWNFLEIGAVYVSAVTAYISMPLLGFWWNFNHGPVPAHDPRLAQAHPEDVGLIGWFGVVHLLSFAVIYVPASGRAPFVMARLQHVEKSVLPAALLLFAAINAFLLLMHLAYDLSADSYVESYAVSDRLPLVLGQVYRGLTDCRFPLEIIVLVALACHWRKTYPFIVCWLAAIIALTFIQGGRRAAMVLLAGAAAVTVQHLVRPFRVRELAAGALGLLFLFELAGQLRIRSESPQPTAAVQVDLLAGYHTEFDTIFANAYDVYDQQRQGRVGDLPLSWHLADLLALVPPQLLPFEKTNKAHWYSRTFLPEFAALGGSTCFGVVAESILGWGWIDLVWRGLAVGLLYGLAHRYWSRRPESFWAFVFYVWLTASCHWPFRWTTFILLRLYVNLFLPVYLAVRLLAAWIDRLGAAQRPENAGGSGGGDPLHPKLAGGPIAARNGGP